MYRNRTMKPVARLFLALLCVGLLLGSRGGSARAVSTVTAQLRPDFTIVIDGAQRTFFNAQGQQVHPIFYQGTTYLPVRAIGELMGKNVNWDNATKTVTLSGTRTGTASSGTADASARSADIQAELRDDFIIVVDGVTRTFADAAGNRVYPMLYLGSTYLPIRAVGELMGKTVSWDGATNTVTLSGSLVTDADTFSGGQTPAAPSGGSQTPVTPTGGSQTPVTPTGGSSRPASSGNGAISVETAKAKALTHAGLTASQVTFVKEKLEWDDGRQVYDIEFYTSDYAEYDYEIDAVTGEVVGYDYDAEDYTPPAASGSVISRDRAREIALGKVSGASQSNIRKLKLDWDDGKQVYDVEIIYNGWEYEMEIDAVSGKILEYDSEPVGR